MADNTATMATSPGFVIPFLCTQSVLPCVSNSFTGGSHVEYAQPAFCIKPFTIFLLFGTAKLYICSMTYSLIPIHLWKLQKSHHLCYVCGTRTVLHFVNDTMNLTNMVIQSQWQAASGCFLFLFCRVQQRSMPVHILLLRLLQPVHWWMCLQWWMGGPLV